MKNAIHVILLSLAILFCGVGCATVSRPGETPIVPPATLGSQVNFNQADVAAFLQGANLAVTLFGQKMSAADHAKYQLVIDLVQGKLIEAQKIGPNAPVFANITDVASLIGLIALRQSATPPPAPPLAPAPSVFDPSAAKVPMASIPAPGVPVIPVR